MNGYQRSLVWSFVLGRAKNNSFPNGMGGDREKRLKGSWDLIAWDKALGRSSWRDHLIVIIII